MSRPHKKIEPYTLQTVSQPSAQVHYNAWESKLLTQVETAYAANGNPTPSSSGEDLIFPGSSGNAMPVPYKFSNIRPCHCSWYVSESRDTSDTDHSLRWSAKIRLGSGAGSQPVWIPTSGLHNGITLCKFAIYHRLPTPLLHHTGTERRMSILPFAI